MKTISLLIINQIEAIKMGRLKKKTQFVIQIKNVQTNDFVLYLDIIGLIVKHDFVRLTIICQLYMLHDIICILFKHDRVTYIQFFNV